MNKIIKLGLVVFGMCMCGVANAQYQITNGDFESGWEKCYPWEKGSKGSTDYGTEPIGWCVSNVPNSLAGTVGNNVTGYNSNSAVQIINTSAVGNGIPGYMTLGTTWATAETKMTSTRNKDGGVFGGVSFTHRPDALQLVYKRDNSKSSTDVSTVVVYTWKGSTSQANVPSNTAVGVISWGSATKVTMTNRDNNILGVSTNTGGDVTYSSDFKLLSSTTKTITGSASSWTTLEIPLEYKDATVAPEMMNIVISAAGYQDGGASITDGVSMTVDDVKFVYYSELSTATYDGKALAFTNGVASVSGSYDESKLALTSNGHAATIEKSYNGTDELTITVKGENISEDATNYHTYKVKFYTSELTSARYDGSTIRLTVSQPSCTQLYDESKLALELSSASATAEKSYDPETGMLTITVKGGNYSTDPSNYNEYTIKFYNVAATMAVKEGVTYGTFAAPIAVSVPSGVKLYKATGVNNNGTITIEAITDYTLAKNTAVIVESTGAVNKEFTGNADLSATKSCTTGLLTGVYTATSAPAGSYVLQSQNNVVGFYKVGSTVPTVGAFRAYIDASKVSNVKAIYFDEATAIKAINALTSGEPTEIYSVSGARQDKLQKGMNIVKMADGSTQKILVK